MDKQRKGFWEFLIEDAINNPTFYTVAEITGIEENGLIIIYSDKHGERITKKVHIENTAKYSLGELLDIQICGKHFPSVFISPGISKT